MAKTKAKNQSVVSTIFKRYFIDAMSAMALGLFASLIIGLIISQLSKLPGLGFLSAVTGVLAATSPVVGSAIGVAISRGLNADNLVMFSCAACGAVGYEMGGPVGAYIAAVIGSEMGSLVSKKTPVDIIVTPIVTIVCGGLAGSWVGPYINEFMTWLGNTVNSATYMAPLPMGVAVGTIVGIVLTLPISSAALCIMLGLSGLAAGAATAGCSAQMVGFAVISWCDNGFSGLISQGIGTSMLQVPNIMRNPRIWIAPTAASAITGAVSSQIFRMTSIPAGAGMGTSGLVGQISMFSDMAPTHGAVPTLLMMLFVHIILPIIICIPIDRLLRHIGWVKKGDMAIRS
ncbi:MAG: PTS sugar transporter subunit IIC [Clostridia bacterium]|nr:PTS sugar transporter subunit IIC [Clostridia bacterium]